MLRKHLTATDGFVLYTTSVLGLGIIVLPSIAARLAGPWSIVIWMALAGISYPMARVMSELARRHPSASGVIEFISHGLGKEMGQLTGVLYLTAIFVGAPATALFFSEYLTKLMALSHGSQVLVAFCFLAALIGINLADVEMTMRIQRYTFIGFLVLVTMGILLSFAHIDPARFTDIKGVGPSHILKTTLICFFAFVGWETAAFSGEEFHDPNDMVKALGASVAVVGVLFTMLSIAIVGVLSRATLASSNASISDLLRVSIGAHAECISAVAAISIIFIMMISWVRGASRLVFGLARDGSFPAWLSEVDPRTHTPRRALLALGCIWGLSLLLFWVCGFEVDDYLKLASANFLTTYVIIILASWRILVHEPFKIQLTLSSLALVIIAMGGYQALWYPATVAALFLGGRRMVPALTH